MGEGESSIENRLIPFLQNHPHVSICPYCSPAKIRYQLTADVEYEKGKYVIFTDEDFEKAIGDYLTFEFSMVMQGREYLFKEDGDNAKS